MEQLNNKKVYKQGVAFAILCAVLWGLLPVYWKSLDPINPLVILLYRIVLAGGFAFILAIVLHKWKGTLEPLKEKGILKAFFLTGILISTNWGIYIWAINNGYIIQTSIGYYIEPLFVCIFGIMLFKEKLNKYKLTAIILASSAVILMLLYYREFPVIALSLAVSFASYAAIKKKYKLNAVLALFYETMLLMPIAIIIIIYLELTGRGVAASAQPYQWGLLALAGLLTGVPLILFAMATNRISMISLGLIEYISPSLTLLLGIFVYKERFETIQLMTFGIIWIGLVIFTIGEVKDNKKLIDYNELKEQSDEDE